MKLLNVKIEGFRNIESDSIEFGNGITSLVSTNSYGKSNLMLAIDFAVDFIKADEEMKAAMMSWVNGIPFNRYVESHNFVADFLFSALINGVEYNINYGYEFVWIKNKGETDCQRVVERQRRREIAEVYPFDSQRRKGFI